MGLFAGKKGLVLGVANDFSIAWAISQKLLDEGAEIGFTHLPGEKMERRVRKLADPIGAKLITPCDVQKDEDVARVFDEAQETYGVARLRAPLDRLRADRRHQVPVRRMQPRGVQDGDGHQRLLAGRSSPGTRPSRCPTAARSSTLTYFGGERVVSGYNLMGVCKAALDASVRYLAYDLGPKKIRVNAVSAGPVKTLAASAVGDSDKLAGLYEAVSPAGPEHHPRGGRLGGHVPALRPGQRDHRRDPPRRLRLQRHGLARPGHRGGQGRQARLNHVSVQEPEPPANPGLHVEAGPGPRTK